MKRRKIIIAAIAVLAVAVIAASAYLINMFGLLSQGNSSQYSVRNTAVNENSPIKDKTVIFLGSSVTRGYGAKGESFVDYLEKADGIIAVNESVSNTTLVENSGLSYVSRLRKIDKSIAADCFICQLSTNDANKEMPLGEISDSFDINELDTTTVAGAIEYIIGYARQTWNCPVAFYTGLDYGNEHYVKMVKLLNAIAEKWGIDVLDFYNDKDMNSVSREDYDLYMTDRVHPARAGYKLWWLPQFENYLYNKL